MKAEERDPKKAQLVRRKEEQHRWRDFWRAAAAGSEKEEGIDAEDIAELFKPALHFFRRKIEGNEQMETGLCKQKRAKKQSGRSSFRIIAVSARSSIGVELQMGRPRN
ncbi:hypothetical protein ACLOJK_001608 [Asimina triloba]